MIYEPNTSFSYHWVYSLKEILSSYLKDASPTLSMSRDRLKALESLDELILKSDKMRSKKSKYVLQSKEALIFLYLSTFGPDSEGIHSTQNILPELCAKDNKNYPYCPAQLFSPPTIDSLFPGLNLKIPYLISLSFSCTGEVMLNTWVDGSVLSIVKINFFLL